VETLATLDSNKRVGAGASASHSNISTVSTVLRNSNIELASSAKSLKSLAASSTLDKLYILCDEGIVDRIKELLLSIALMSIHVYC
jgi:hypothetical protein